MPDTLRLAVAIALGLSALSGADAWAAPCRDLHGQFVACPPSKAPERCIDLRSKKAVKCGTAGSTSVHAGIRRFNG